MAVKSIIDIELNDDAFKAFSKLFDEYQQSLKKMPSQWQGVASGTKRAATELEKNAATLNAFGKTMSDIEKAQKRSADAAASSGRIWHTMARDTKTVAGNIKDITVQLLQWANITGVVAGLVTGGGLFGITRLAQGAAFGRQQASGLDVTYGQNRAFAINYGRYLDSPGGTLGAVSNGLHDATSPAYRALLNAGISPQFLQSHNAAEVTAEFLRRVPGKIPHGTAQERALEGNTAHAYGFDSIISQQEINRYINSSPEERRKQQQGFVTDSKTFDQTEQTQRAWQDFSTQMERAQTTIEEVFVKGLTPLAGPLTQLSGAISSSISALLSSDKLKEWINDLGQAIKSFSDYLLTDDFKKDMAGFVHGVEAVVSALGKMTDWIMWITGNKPDNTAPNQSIAPKVKGPMSRGAYEGQDQAGPPAPYGSAPPSRDELRRLFNYQDTTTTGQFKPMSFDGSGITGAGFQNIAYRPDGGSSGNSMDRFKSAFMTLIFGAESVSQRFKDLSEQAKDLSDRFGALNGAGDAASGLSADGSGSVGGSGGGGRARGVADYGTFTGNAGGKVSGGSLSKANRLMNFLVSKHGWTPAAAAIAAAQASSESSFDPKAFRANDAGPGLPSIGLFQWNRSRLAALKKFGGSQWQDFDVQSEFFAREAERMMPGWKKERDLSNSGRIGKQFEGYAGPIQAKRSRDSETYLKHYKPDAGLDSYHGVKSNPRIIIDNNTGGNSNISAMLMTVATG